MRAADSGVVLIGLPGSGKTSIGRHLAAMLGRTFVDTDDLVQRLTGLSAAEHNLRSGEAGFRAVETDAVRAACRERGSVIATGGGSVILRSNREVLWAHGTVVWVRVPSSVLVERLGVDPVPRPMLQPYGVERMDELLAQRTRYYRAADIWIDGTPAPQAVARELHRLLVFGMPVARGAIAETLDADG